MASSSENKRYIDDVIGSWPLDDAIGWIQTNLSPEDVFTDSQLSDWAIENDFIIED